MRHGGETRIRAKRFEIMLVISDEKSKKKKRDPKQKYPIKRKCGSIWKRTKGSMNSGQTSKCNKPRVRGAGERGSDVPEKYEENQRP